VAVAGDVAVADWDVARATESPITAQISAAATIHLLLAVDSHRRAIGQRARGFVDSSSFMMGLL
jgi:hypothetical protein